jgi:hypothetical protein
MKRKPAEKGGNWLRRVKTSRQKLKLTVRAKTSRQKIESLRRRGELAVRDKKLGDKK